MHLLFWVLFWVLFLALFGDPNLYVESTIPIKKKTSLSKYNICRVLFFKREKKLIHLGCVCVQYNSISQFLWAVFLMLCSPAPDISSVRLAFLSLARRVLLRITGKLVLLLILNYLYSCKPVVVRTLQRHCCIVKFKRLLPNTTLAELSLLSNINTSHSQFNEEWEEGSYKCCVSRDFSRFELPPVWKWEPCMFLFFAMKFRQEFVCCSTCRVLSCHSLQTL